jgi:hypothetical protein
LARFGGAIFCAINGVFFKKGNKEKARKIAQKNAR